MHFCVCVCVAIRDVFMRKYNREFMARAFLKALHLVSILSGIRLVLIVRRCFHPFLQRCSWLFLLPSQRACSKSMHQACHIWPREEERKKV
jgi:hypothetical protein